LNKKHFKNQESRFKVQASKNQYQDSRLNIQESREDLNEISMKRFFQKLSSTWMFSQKMFTKEFLLSGNRLLEYCNRLPVAKNDFEKVFK